MACLYCSSVDHATKKCNIYTNNKARRKRIDEKKRCEKLCVISEKFRCEECKALLKCYICFSKDQHRMVNCPDKEKVPKLFPPNIDKILLPRFLEMMDIEEKYYMAYTFPSVFALIKLQFIKVTYKQSFNHSCPTISQESDLVVADKIYNSAPRGQFKTLILLKQNVFRAKCLNLDLFLLSAIELLNLLSTKTTSLTLTGRENKKYKQKVTFREIAENAPNLEEIDLLDADIKNLGTWPDELLKFNRACKLKISIANSGMNFKIPSLVNLIKVKPVTLYLNITLPDTYPKNGIFLMFKKNLEKHFFQTKSEEEHQICVRYDNKASEISSRIPVYYKLKNVVSN